MQNYHDIGVYRYYTSKAHLICEIQSTMSVEQAEKKQNILLLICNILWSLCFDLVPSKNNFTSNVCKSL